jgi:polyisoprenoid-binding protein YceI
MKNTRILNTVRLILAVAASFSIAHAAPQSFDFKDPKGVNNVQFQLDAPLESISGTATGIEGTIVYDAEAPEKVSGKITLQTSSIKVGNPIMVDHLKSEHWLDVEKYPTITFEAVKAANPRSEKNAVVLDVTGKLTVKDVTKEVTVPVSFTYLADRLGARLGQADLKGDLLVVRAKFDINRSEFNIQPGKNADKVSETIELALSIAGSSPK